MNTTMVETAKERTERIELAAIDERFAARARELEREMATAERAITRLNDDFVERWGRNDGDRRRIDHRPAFDAAERALGAALQPFRARFQAARGQKEDLPRERQVAVQQVFASITYGPAIPVPEVTVPARADDKTLNALIAKRDAAISSRQEHEGEIAALETFVPKIEVAVADLALRCRHHLATSAEVEAENGHLDSLRRSISEHHAALATLERTVAELNEKIAERESGFEAERLAELDAAITRALFAHADALVPAMATSTTLKRLLGETGSGRWAWTLEGLDADDGKSAGRELLERCLSLGWQPSNLR